MPCTAAKSMMLLRCERMSGRGADNAYRSNIAFESLMTSWSTAVRGVPSCQHSRDGGYHKIAATQIYSQVYSLTGAIEETRCRSPIGHNADWRRFCGVLQTHVV